MWRPSAPAGRNWKRKCAALAAALTDERLNESLDYRLLNGTAGRNRLWHMIQHMVNHATYHRGQLTTMLRQLGAAPPKSMDHRLLWR